MTSFCRDPGYFDDVAVDVVRDFEKQILSFIEGKYPEILPRSRKKRSSAPSWKKK